MKQEVEVLSSARAVSSASVLSRVTLTHQPKFLLKGPAALARAPGPLCGRAATFAAPDAAVLEAEAGNGMRLLAVLGL